MKSIQVIRDGAQFLEAIEKSRRPFHASYYSMFSSVWNTIVTDPLLMTVPVDDHMVHRGDAVFETFKCLGGSLYNMKAHLDRLERSAASLEIKLPAPPADIAETVVQTVRAGGNGDCYVRIFLSRGPGSFGVNPYDCAASQFYVMTARLDPPFMQRHPGGARVKASAIPVKPGFLASTKTCNYLTNVLMKKEAVQAGVDFVISFDENGFLAEGATENAGIVASDGALLFPRLDRILAGTTMLRVIEIAASLVASGRLARVGFEDIPDSALRACRELLIVGTSPNVTAATEFDGRPVGDGKPGPIQRELDALLAEDMRGNSLRLTPVGL
jgi:branched-subunit amino acid aminotransferase/4-amino-4-deoxychorismate lyase